MRYSFCHCFCSLLRFTALEVLTDMFFLSINDNHLPHFSGNQHNCVFPYAWLLEYQVFFLSTGADYDIYYIILLNSIISIFFQETSLFPFQRVLRTRFEIILYGFSSIFCCGPLHFEQPKTVYFNCKIKNPWKCNSPWCHHCRSLSLPVSVLAVYSDQIPMKRLVKILEPFQDYSKRSYVFFTKKLFWMI